MVQQARKTTKELNLILGGLLSSLKIVWQAVYIRVCLPTKSLQIYYYIILKFKV